MTVSYTHLDVYKRQEPRSVIVISILPPCKNECRINSKHSFIITHFSLSKKRFLNFFAVSQTLHLEFFLQKRRDQIFRHFTVFVPSHYFIILAQHIIEGLLRKHLTLSRSILHSFCHNTLWYCIVSSVKSFSLVKGCLLYTSALPAPSPGQLPPARVYRYLCPDGP